jgi:hypothetical protein
LSRDARPLWSGGSLPVAHLPLGAPLAAALQSAATARRVRRGLESVTALLDAEARGQGQVDRASGVARGARISRLLFVSHDGAERFYRHVETLLMRHAGRVLGVRLDASAADLGRLLFGREAIARLVLLDQKDAVSAALLAIANA